MADPVTPAAFCSLSDVQAKEPKILDLAPEGNITKQLLDATQDILDSISLRFPTSVIDKIPTPDPDDPTTIPRQFRLPCVFRVLETVYRQNARDEESPYWTKAQKYEDLYYKWIDMIERLDLDQDEDGTIDENEKDTFLFRKRIRRT